MAAATPAEALARAMEFTELVERHIRADLPEGICPANEGDVASAVYALRATLASALVAVSAPPPAPIATLDAIEGESERDKLARTAMHGMLCFGSTEERDPQYIGRTSYAIADGMLAARRGAKA